jgi:hypothetical protein
LGINYKALRGFLLKIIKMTKLTEKEWDIKYLKEQIFLCEKGINEGNWMGYAENLKIRKQKLRSLKKELKELLNH